MSTASPRLLRKKQRYARLYIFTLAVFLCIGGLTGLAFYQKSMHAPQITSTTSTMSLTTTKASRATPPAVTLIGAGDIASCDDLSGAQATAKLVSQYPDATVFTLGDNAYEEGSAANYTQCYNPTWGAFKTRTRPVIGNHEYETAQAKGYFDYFGTAAGEPGKGYYSYDLGTWHIVVLNGNCWAVGGCNAGSPQESWLEADLATHPAICTVAMEHEPRFSSGKEHGNTPDEQPLWQALYNAGAEIVLSGHDHDYERFAPQTPTGQADPQKGIREFVVGTGGNAHYVFATPQPNSEVRNADTFGVLKLALKDKSYDWQFLPVAGQSFTDAGTASCH